MPVLDTLWSFLNSPWIVGIGGGIIAAALIAIGAKFTSRGKAAWRWIRSWRLTQEPKPLPWVAPPRWELRQREEHTDVFGLRNSGGTARDVHLIAEDDDVVIAGVLDWEIFEAETIAPFLVRELHQHGFGNTWLTVHSRDSNGIPVEPARVKIPGLTAM